MLDTEVERGVLLVLVEEAQLGALLGVDDGQDASDGLAQIVAEDAEVSHVFVSCEFLGRYIG